MEHQEFRTRKITVTTAGTPVPVVPSIEDDIVISDFEFYVPASNTGDNVYLGYEGFDKTNWGPRPKGSFYNPNLGAESPTRGGVFFRLKDIYFDADSNGDVVYVYYTIAVQD